MEYTFNTQGADLIKMVAIDVSIDTEQPSNDGADSVPEIARERGACRFENGFGTSRNQGENHRVPILFGKTFSSSRMF